MTIQETAREVAEFECRELFARGFLPKGYFVEQALKSEREKALREAMAAVETRRKDSKLNAFHDRAAEDASCIAAIEQLIKQG